MHTPLKVVAQRSSHWVLYLSLMHEHWDRLPMQTSNRNQNSIWKNSNNNDEGNKVSSTHCLHLISSKDKWALQWMKRAQLFLTSSCHHFSGKSKPWFFPFFPDIHVTGLCDPCYTVTSTQTKETAVLGNKLYKTSLVRDKNLDFLS